MKKFCPKLGYLPLVLLLFLLQSPSCSFRKNQLENQSQHGHSELYAEPDAPEKSIPKGYKRIVIAATNDLQGSLREQAVSVQDKHEKGQRLIQVGGAAIIHRYFQILRDQYKDVLLVDSGDIFSDRTEEAASVRKFFELAKYDAVTLGLKDFNLRVPENFANNTDFFKDFAAQSKTPVILSNLYELKTAKVVDWKGTAPYLLKEINGVKIGIIGLIPDDLVGLTTVDARLGLYVENMLESTLRYSRLLRSQGAEIIVVLTHQGLYCGEKLAQDLELPITKVNFEPEQDKICNLDNLLGNYLKRLPPQLVDVVIGGRNNQKVANIINSVVVLSSFENGKSFSYVELFVDKHSSKLNREKTVVHQPVMFCHQFFAKTNDCYTEDKSVDHRKTKPARFLDQEIKPDESVLEQIPELKTSQTLPVTSMKQIIPGALEQVGGEIAYAKNSNIDAKLVQINILGSDLAQILEKDFNRGFGGNWYPYPFRLENDVLKLTLSGLDLVPQQTYRLVVSAEDIFRHPWLKRQILQSSHQSHFHSSWRKPVLEETVSTSLSSLKAPGL